MSYRPFDATETPVLEWGDPPLSIGCEPLVYQPSNDSFLLIKGLEQLLEERWTREERKLLSVMELGTGTGIVGIWLLKAGVEELTMSDVSPRALDCARANLERNQVSAKLVKASLFQGVDTDFDLVVFNPPYLPKEEKEPDDFLTTALSGGEKGHETLEAFLKELPGRLKDDGVAVIIISSINPVERLRKESPFSWRLLGKENFFFEQLYCYALFKF